MIENQIALALLKKPKTKKQQKQLNSLLGLQQQNELLKCKA